MTLQIMIVLVAILLGFSSLYQYFKKDKVKTSRNFAFASSFCALLGTYPLFF
jgi:uncharacterized membrane protein SirB2